MHGTSRPARHATALTGAALALLLLGACQSGRGVDPGLTSDNESEAEARSSRSGFDRSGGEGSGGGSGGGGSGGGGSY